MNDVWRAVRSNWTRTVLVFTVAVGLGMAVECHAQGKDGGEFDGAVWRFTLTPKVAGPGQLRGHFRVSNHVLYQKADIKDPNYTKQVGKDNPQRRAHTRVEFTDLRALDKRGVPHSGFKGTVLLKGERFGHWSGSFIDSQGRHWNIQCTRVQE